MSRLDTPQSMIGQPAPIIHQESVPHMRPLLPMEQIASLRERAAYYRASAKLTEDERRRLYLNGKAADLEQEARAIYAEQEAGNCASQEGYAQDKGYDKPPRESNPLWSAACIGGLMIGAALLALMLI